MWLIEDGLLGVFFSHLAPSELHGSVNKIQVVLN